MKLPFISDVFTRARQSGELKKQDEQRRLQQKAEDAQIYQAQIQVQREQSQLLRHLGLTNSLLAFLVLILCLTLLKLTASFSIPIVLGILIFMMLFPWVERLNHWGLPYGLSCTVVLIAFHLMILSLLLLLSMASFNSLLQALPSYYIRLQSLLHTISQMADQRGIDISRYINWDSLSKGFDTASSILLSMSGSISSFLSSGLTLGLTAFLVLLFMLLEGRAFLATIERCFAPHRSQAIISAYRHSVEQISSYLLLKTVVSLLTGSLIGLGLWLLGVDFPMVWGILGFILNFIPNIGSLLHTVLVMLFALLQFSDDLPHLLAIILLLGGVQFCMGNFVEPRLQGDRLRLSPVFILISLYIWAYIWGIAGMLLAVPLLSIIKIICQNVAPLRTLAYFLENAYLPNNKSLNSGRRNVN